MQPVDAVSLVPLHRDPPRDLNLSQSPKSIMNTWYNQGRTITHYWILAICAESKKEIGRRRCSLVLAISCFMRLSLYGGDFVAEAAHIFDVTSFVLVLDAPTPSSISEAFFSRRKASKIYAAYCGASSTSCDQAHITHQSAQPEHSQ